MKLFKIMFTVIFLLASCSSDKKKSELYFFDTIESNYAWNGNHIPCIIKSDLAHSGMFVCKVNKDFSSSVTFNMRLGDISAKPLKSVTVSGWVMLIGNGSEHNLVVDIRTKNDSTGEFLAHNTGYNLEEVNQWTKAKITYNLT